MESLESLQYNDPKTFSLQTIRDNISLLKLHLHQCEKQRNFQEAINVSRKISELEKIEKDKIYENFQKRQIEEKTKLEAQLAESKETIDEDKIIEQQSFDMKIQSLIEEFNNKQELELVNFKIGLENAIPQEPNLHEINMKFEKEIQKNIRSKNYQKAEELTNQLQQIKDKKMGEHNKFRKKEIERGMKSIKTKQLEEKKKFEMKIQKQIDEFNKRHNNKYSKLYNSITLKRDELNKKHKCEKNNFNTLLNEQKRHGIILSSQMREQAKEYLSYVKQSQNDIEDTFDNMPNNNSKYYSNYVY